MGILAVVGSDDAQVRDRVHRDIRAGLHRGLRDLQRLGAGTAGDRRRAEVAGLCRRPHGRGAFSRAVAFGAMLMGLLNWGNFYIYLSGSRLGAAVAAIAFPYLNPDDVREGPLARRLAAPAPAAATVTAAATAPATSAPGA